MKDTTALKLWLLVFLFVCLLAWTSHGQSTMSNLVSLAWDYNPPDGMSNYVFLIRSTNSPAAPLPWPVIGSVTGMIQSAVSLTVTSWQTQFFYVTVTDRRSSLTNYIAESPTPSSVVTVRMIPGVANVTIQKGP